MPKKPGKSASTRSAEEDERLRHSERWPAFTGEYEFELAVVMLGERITRRAKADYRYTPEWEYFDLKKQAPYVGWDGSSIALLVLTEPGDGHTAQDDKGRWRKLKPSWEQIDLAKTGVLPDEVWEKLDGLIDERCKALTGSWTFSPRTTISGPMLTSLMRAQFSLAAPAPIGSSLYTDNSSIKASRGRAPCEGFGSPHG